MKNLSEMFEEAQKALANLDGQLGTINFNPHDPTAVEVAIRAADSIIDERVGRYSNNPLVASLAEGMKEAYRSGIVEKAAEARLARDDS